MVIDGVLKMCDMSSANCYVINHTFSQQDCDSNDGGLSTGNGFINRHTLSQCDDSRTFRDMDGGCLYEKTSYFH